MKTADTLDRANPASVGYSDSTSSGPDLEENKPTRGGSPLYIIAVLAVAISATGIFFYLRARASTGANVHSESESTLTLDTFVVNLDGAGQRAYLRVGITLGLSHALPRKKDDLPMALLRDAILSVLSNADPQELLVSEGKEKLKQDLLKALQERAPDLGIENVYFTEFLVQM